MWRTVILILAACSHESDLATAARRRLVVRMATAEPPRDPFALSVDSFFECKNQGSTAPELRDAVIAFARMNLVEPMVQLGLGSSDDPIQLDFDCKQHHHDGVFTTISVKPTDDVFRLSVGQQEVTHGRCSWGGATVYCAHVLREPTGIAVVLSEGRTLIR
ncbi:MAG: hypothetical protein QM831_13415 [Kofleriaceae bacterium]